MNQKKSKIFVAGGTGFVGSALIHKWLSISSANCAVVQTRWPEQYKDSERVKYVASYGALLPNEEICALINLAGAPIADNRWTDSRKKIIEKSRIDFTRDLLGEVKKREPPPVVVNASAIGFYGSENTSVDESSPSGKGYAAELCQRWESEALRFDAVSRLVIMRLGVVLGRRGALAKLLPLYRIGLGGPIGSGEQWMSWIHIDDAVDAIITAIAAEHWRGVYNLCAPEPVRQRGFATALGQILRRPTFMPTPAMVLSMVFGEMAKELLIGGQQVLPTRLREEGFEYTYPGLLEALTSAVSDT